MGSDVDIAAYKYPSNGQHVRILGDKTAVDNFTVLAAPHVRLAKCSQLANPFQPNPANDMVEYIANGLLHNATSLAAATSSDRLRALAGLARKSSNAGNSGLARKE